MVDAGRSLSLLDPTYASKYIPIIASVSEHQPPAWNSYFTDVHILVLLAPLGLIACFRPLTDASLFLVLYGVTAVYFSGVMVRAALPLLCACHPVLFAPASLLSPSQVSWCMLLCHCCALATLWCLLLHHGACCFGTAVYRSCCRFCCCINAVCFVSSVVLCTASLLCTCRVLCCATADNFSGVMACTTASQLYTYLVLWYVRSASVVLISQAFWIVSLPHCHLLTSQVSPCTALTSVLLALHWTTKPPQDVVLYHVLMYS